MRSTHNTAADSEIQVRMHFCRALKASDTPFLKTRVMTNMYTGQLKKIQKAVDKFHDDIKYEYKHELRELEL